MAEPDVKILAVSNVYCRLMHFKNKGDVELGHCHTYDHGTLLSSGRLLVEMFNEDDVSLSTSKVFEAPTFIFIHKNVKHQLTALEDNTIAVCIHALRAIGDNIVDPDFFVEQTVLADAASKETETEKVIGKVLAWRGLRGESFVVGRKLKPTNDSNNE